MKKYIWAWVIGVAIIVFARYAQEGYKNEIKQLKQQLAHAQIHVPVERDTIMIHDTLREVATSPVIMAELRDLRRQHLIDEETIKALGLKMKQLDAVQTTSFETKDTARAAVVINSSLFSYEDEWSHLEFSLDDSTFYYNIRDSLETVVYHEYKHHLLWWHWGVKGYKVKILNFNPNSTIRYNTYVKPEK
ncbi:MAG: hypothetical protein K6G70_01935 [Bacteroidaceae bacterium]|nr:hypothetical protein [Bacteroidaceae bacterium]